MSYEEGRSRPFLAEPVVAGVAVVAVGAGVPAAFVLVPAPGATREPGLDPRAPRTGGVVVGTVMTGPADTNGGGKGVVGAGAMGAMGAMGATGSVDGLDPSAGVCVAEVAGGPSLDAARLRNTPDVPRYATTNATTAITAKPIRHEACPPV